MSDGLPSLALAGPRATITLNRPGQHNRLGPADVDALRGMLAELRGREELRVVIISATGPSFCAGYDLGALAADTARASAAPDYLIAVIDELEALAVPSIAAINGSLYGGGVDLALACDFRIGVTPARAFIPICRLGLQYPGPAMRRLVAGAGLAMARKLLLAGETIDAGAMLACGILDEVVAPEALAGRVAALAAHVEAQAPLAVRATKRVLADIAQGGYDVEAARRNAAALARSEDYREGLAALREKRTPIFQGR